MVIKEEQTVEHQSRLVVTDATGRLNYTGLRRNTPKEIIIHSTRNYSSYEELEKAHFERGFAGVGYHFFITPKGLIYQSRPIFVEGAHALGSNTSSMGVAVQSPDGQYITPETVFQSKSLFAEINRIYGAMPLISHTLAQVRHYNALLEKAGLPQRFEAEQNIVNPDKFEALKAKIDTFTGSLPTLDSLNLIKQGLKAFKNCPGPLIFQLI